VQGVFQRCGLIRYSRGRMQILDPEGLRDGACECYEVIEAQFDRIFGRPWREMAREQQEYRDRIRSS
jgi:hypothetical protein